MGGKKYMKIQCIIFDFGGVIGYPHDKERVKTMAELLQMKVKTLRKHIFIIEQHMMKDLLTKKNIGSALVAKIWIQ